MMSECEHFQGLQTVTPSINGCEECLQVGDRWVHLRICLQCGHVGCCDSSKNKHATAHYQASGHPIFQSFEWNRQHWSILHERLGEACDHGVPLFLR